MKKEWELQHIGLVVHDLDRSISYYQTLGIGIIQPKRIITTADNAKLRVCFVRMGLLDIEFLQPIEGESRQLDFLRNHGEGVQHLAFTVTDIDKETVELVEHGAKVLFTLDTAYGSRVAYFDTGEIGDILIALIQPRTVI